MPNERFMRHNYGASGYVKPNAEGDSPLTPWGEQLARVQEMCTEGYAGLSQRDKDDIRAVYHRMLDLTGENEQMRAEIAETMETVSRMMAAPEVPEAPTVCVFPIGSTTCGYTRATHLKHDGSQMDHEFTDGLPGAASHGSGSAA